MKKKTTKYIVKVAWDRESANFAAYKGWKELAKRARQKKYDYLCTPSHIEFDTEAEANAYVMGIEDAAGWNEPFHELIKPK